MVVNRDLTEWNVEDDDFWEKTGEKIANRNLLISVGCIILAFCVWMYWSIITVQMINLGFNFTPDQLFSLIAIGGISGATLRIPSTFFIRLAGGRNTIFLTTFFLLIPALGTTLGLMNPKTPLWQFQLLSLLGGIGGGNFSPSMFNIGCFFPKKLQRGALSTNAGMGNFGVTVMQVVIPLVLSVGIIGDSLPLAKDSGTLIGILSVGTHLFVQNGALIWVALLVPFSILAWIGMNNITTENVSPNLGSTMVSFGKIIGMTIIGLATSGIAILFILPKESNGLFTNGVPWYIVLPLTAIVTIACLRWLPGGIGVALRRQYSIFTNPHTWILTLLYTMAFGAFIGFSGAFALSIKLIFGFKHILDVDGVTMLNIPNPNTPSVLSYAWLGAFIAALIRPLGGVIAEKIGGSLVTALMTILMILCSLGIGYYMYKASRSPTPEIFFMSCFILFLLLFFATGVANGSIFRTSAVIFAGPQKGPLLAWIATIAAYGACIVPKIIAPQIEAGTPENAMIGLAIFDFICLIIIIICYLRPGVKYFNP